jgi:hypothetical protein
MRLACLGLCVWLSALGCASVSRHPVADVHRFAWTQSESEAVASTYHYTVAIDGGAHRPLQASCAAAGYSSVCTGVAKMSPGSHLVVIAAVAEDGARQVTIATVNVERLRK